MMGLTEDLLFAVTSYIIDNWDRTNGNVEFFANKVKKSGLSTEDLSNYLIEKGKICPVWVTIVFDSIVNPVEKGGEV